MAGISPPVDIIHLYLELYLSYTIAFAQVIIKELLWAPPAYAHAGGATRFLAIFTWHFSPIAFLSSAPHDELPESWFEASTHWAHLHHCIWLHIALPHILPGHSRIYYLHIYAVLHMHVIYSSHCLIIYDNYNASQYTNGRGLPATYYYDIQCYIYRLASSFTYILDSFIHKPCHWRSLAFWAHKWSQAHFTTIFAICCW